MSAPTTSKAKVIAALLALIIFGFAGYLGCWIAAQAVGITIPQAAVSAFIAGGCIFLTAKFLSTMA